MRRGPLSIAAWLLCSTLSAQEAPKAAEPSPSARERTLAVARKIMTAARYCTMVTMGENEAQARIVDPIEPDAAFVVHVATNPRSRKVRELRADSRVTLLYFDTERLAYVTVVGRATEVEDALKPSHYKKEWEGFFHRGQPATYVLHRIVPTRLEVVSPKDGLSGDPVTWKPEIVDLK